MPHGSNPTGSCAAGLRRILQTYRYAIDDRPEDTVTRIPCPALVMHGDGDPIGSCEWARELAERLPHGRLVLLDGVAHTIDSDALGAWPPS